jgi:hypothetical protein
MGLIKHSNNVADHGKGLLIGSKGSKGNRSKMYLEFSGVIDNSGGIYLNFRSLLAANFHLKLIPTGWGQWM